MPENPDLPPNEMPSSEAHHLALLDAIDQGFCIIELLFESEQAVDYRFVAVNAAFETQAGLISPVGKRVLELVPGLEPFWLEVYGQVALSGEAKRFENYAEATRRWYDVYAFRVGKPVERQVAVLFKDITRQRRAELALSEANRELEARVRERTREVEELAAKLTMAEVREQARLARVLHDDLQQQLYAAGFALRSLRQQLPKGDKLAAESLAEVKARIDDAVSISRDVTVQLSPPVLQRGGLAEMLGWLSTDMDTRYGLAVRVNVSGVGEDFTVLNEAARVLLFNLVRELLFNVVKHAGVREATVTLARVAGGFMVEVADTGTGFDPSDLGSAGLGLSGVRQRLELFGGTLELSAVPGEGTRAAIVLPTESLNLG